MVFFPPLRIGLKKNIELSVHPILFFIVPNLKLKKNWTRQENKTFQIATEHGLTFPSILLNSLAKEGTGGLLPAGFKISPILSLKNKIVVSFYYHKLHNISLKAGLEINTLQSFYNEFPPIELLFVYPRTTSYHNFYTGELALDLNGIWFNRLGYHADIKLFLIPDQGLKPILEFNPKLYYHFSNKIRIMAGLLIGTGNVPHEKAKLRTLPVFDLQFSLKRNKKK